MSNDPTTPRQGPPPITPPRATATAPVSPMPTPVPSASPAPAPAAFGPVPTTHVPPAQPMPSHPQQWQAQQAAAAPYAHPQQPYPLGYQPPGKSGTAIAGEVAMNFGGFAWLAIRRIVKSSFYLERATDHERAKLANASKPVTSALAQDYAAWRRTTLWLCVGLLSLSWVFGIFKAHWVGEQDIGVMRNVLVINGMFAALLVSQLGAIALLVLAALFWFNITLTRQCARFAWFLQFFAPFVLFAIPIHALLDTSHIQQAGGEAGEMLAYAQEMMMGLAVTIYAVLQLVPRVIGLFPGLIRSSLSLKTLLPESSVPGWVTVALCPLYALLFAILVVVCAQSGIGWQLAIAMLCMTAAPLLCVLRARRLMSPQQPVDAHRTVQSLRRQMLVLLGAAIVLFIWWYFSAPTFIDIGWGEVFLLITGTFANVFLLTVVSSDLLLGLMREAFEQNKVFVGSPLHGQLNEKFGELASVGFTTLESGEREVAGHIGSLLSTATRASKEWLSANGSGTSSTPPSTPAAPLNPNDEGRMPNQ